MMGSWDPRRIAIDGPIKSDDGYGHMVENQVLAFDRAGFVVRCGTHWGHTDLRLVHPRVQQLAQLECGRERVGMRCSQPDSFKDCPSTFKIGFSMFEFTKLPKTWVQGSIYAHINMVPSNWCKEIWVNSGVTAPVEVNNLGVDTEVFTYYDRPVRDTFTFVMSGTMSERKSPWLAWEAFKLAFPDQQDVRLVMKSVSHLPLPKLEDPRISTINESWAKDAMVALLHQSDCFVYPTRSEGFGLSPAEAMSTGLPVICTGETSCKDFVFEDHAYPLSITGWENVPSHWGDIGAFTCPSRDHLVELMRHVYAHRDEAREKGRKAAAFVRSQLTWDHHVQRFISIVERYL